jgi:hypothetical protein
MGRTKLVFVPQFKAEDEWGGRLLSLWSFMVGNSACDGYVTHTQPLNHHQQRSAATAACDINRGVKWGHVSFNVYCT